MVSILQNNQYLGSLFPTEIINMMRSVHANSSKAHFYETVWITSEVAVYQ